MYTGVLMGFGVVGQPDIVFERCSWCKRGSAGGTWLPPWWELGPVAAVLVHCGAIRGLFIE
jgi:hypothetical protein